MKWTRIYGYFKAPVWGFKVADGKIRKRDLPEDFQCCVEPFEGALPDFRLHSGRLWLAEYQASPFVGDWPVPLWREILPGAYVLEWPRYRYSVAGALSCPVPLGREDGTRIEKVRPTQAQYVLDRATFTLQAA